ncbi:MAG: PepSY domain-containing protein [Proteobacteria bacterium]|nr:PepSY domain-containing protein [Pseudomonadota bacterium]
MNSARIVRKTHRWAGLVIGIQLLLWTISGFYFSLIPIDEIHGDHLAMPAGGFEPTALENFQAPGLALNPFMSQHPAAVIESVTLKHLRGRDVYRLRALLDGKPVNRLVDAHTGRPVEMMQTTEAELIAAQLIKFTAPLSSIELVESVEVDSEFRGRVLPLYRLKYEHESGISLYLDAWTGELVARRTSYWRGFDFLWMLHIMDYDERDDFNNNFLRVFAFSGILFVISGFVLWLLSTRFMQKRRNRRI